MAQYVEIRGIRELDRAFRLADRELAKELRRELTQVGKPIEADARSRLSTYNSRSAGGIRARVRGGATLVIEERYPRVTGKRPDWGARIISKALIPARSDHWNETVERLDLMLDRLGVRAGF